MEGDPVDTAIMTLQDVFNNAVRLSEEIGGIWVGQVVGEASWSRGTVLFAESWKRRD